MLPLANGTLVRFNVNQGSAVEIGPTWRGPDVARDARGWVIDVAENHFAVSDGDRKVTWLIWTSPRSFELNTNQGYALSAPLRLLARNAGRSTVVAADVEGAVVNLLLGQKSLEKEGVISGVSFDGQTPVYIIDDRLIVSPVTLTRRAIRYTSEGSKIVGDLLHLTSNKFAFANQAGQLTVLDVQETGAQPRILSLGSVSPVGGPMQFGGELFVPLIDGTAAVVPIRN